MLHLHRSERADGLAAALADMLGRPPADPFAPDLVAVPTRGMERWLSQRLSAHLGAAGDGGDGVCAGVLFPSPRRLLADALAAASGVDPEADPWLPEHCTWPLLELIDLHLDERWLRSLATYLGHGAGEPDPVRRARRLGTARHLAELFHRYGLYRPELVCRWAGGDDGGLPEGAGWQPQLWRALRAHIGTPSPAERLGPACERLVASGELIALPERLSLFGLTRLPAGEVRLLRALAGQHDVHLFLLHPSPALWDAVARETGPAARSRRRDPTAELAANPLLASWGRDVREMQLVLAAGGEHGDADHHHPLLGTPATLLQRLQADVLSDQAPPGAPLAGERDARPELDPGDTSVQIHACHGRARQVEVLRDVMLGLLADDPTLEPREVIVMCPDIETFAPLVHATFGAGESEPAAGHVDLRVRLADRSLRQTNPVLAAVAELLELPGRRLTASQVLGFADREPVRRRFALRDDDLSRLQRWTTDAGIRWGLDAAHRAPFKLDRLPNGTWRAGLDRLLLGATMTEEGARLFAGTLPLDDVESGAIDLAGRFAELVDRLGAALDALGATQPLNAWAAEIARAADALTAVSPHEAWQRSELARILDELVVQSAATGAGELALSPPELRALLADRLAGRPTRANFRTGHLTVCTLYPMRSVPHRVVCLLGLDDGAFPRKSPRDGDDVLLADPHIGERDPRSEDRQLLLDALMAASERLLITYAGKDERTNLPRPPAVPVGELLDAIDATVRAPGGPARAQVLLHHPLQPFDVRNFTPRALRRAGPFSFDRVMLAGARALEGPRAPAAPFLSAPLVPLRQEVIALDDLVRFVQHPIRAFVRQRLRIYLGEVEEEVGDALPVELDGLERWDVGQRLLEAELAGTDGRAACLAEIARGTLPPGALGRPVLGEVYPIVLDIRRRAETLAPEPGAAGPLDVLAALPDGRLLTGTIPGPRGEVLLSASYSRVGPRHRLAAWVRLLAATASAPERPLSSITVGRGPGKQSIEVVRVPPLGADAAVRAATALEHLQALVGLYDQGMREPLALYCASSAAYAEAAAQGEDAVAAAGGKWHSDYNFTGEDADPEHELILGRGRPFEDLLEAAPRAQEQGPGWEPSEITRVGRLARRLWSGPLAREEREIA